MHPKGSRALLTYGTVAAATVGVRFVLPQSAIGAHGVLAFAVALVGFVAGLRRHRPPDARAWRFLLAALIIAMASRVVYAFVADAPTLGPTLAVSLGVLLVAAYVCCLVGVVLLGTLPGERPSTDDVLSFALVGISGALVAFVFVVQPAWQVQGAGLTPLRSLLPVLSLALAVMLLRSLWHRSVATSTRMLLAAGFFTFVLSDVLVALGGSAALDGTPASVLRLVAVLFLGAAPLHPSARTSVARDERRQQRLDRNELVAILVAGISGPVSLIVRLEAATRAELVAIGLGSAVLVSLVLARLWRLLVVLGEVSRREHEDRFRALVENAGDVICVADVLGNITYVSPTAEPVWGYRPDEVAASGFGLIVGDDRERFRQVFRQVVAGPPGSSRRVEGVAQHGDGSVRRLEAVCTNRLDEPAIRGVIITSRDVTDRFELQQRLWRQAFVDQLTGLPNRAQLLDRLATTLQQAADDRRPALAVLGLDGFKTINDSLGPQRGDDLLVAIGERLRLGERDDVLVARLGGDEFAVLLPRASGIEDAEAVAKRVLAAVRRPLTIGGRRVEPTASCGVVYATPQTSAPELLRDAEAAMSVAKGEGPGSYRAFDPEMHALAVRRLQLQMDLAVAIEQEQLWVAYQPIHELRTGHLAAVEALLRWDHPVRGAVSPAEFIPLAEASGRIAELGEFVLRRACRDVARLRAESGLDVALSVNLSPAQLGDPCLTELVAAVLADSGLPAQQLTLEVTEGVFLERSRAVLAALRDLRELGVRLAIDDFGTGYCALGYLTDFRFDVVKIDRSFIRVLDGSSDGDRRVTFGILELVAMLEVPAVAEGIETEGQLAELRAVGCEFGQGFLWSRPMPIDQLTLPKNVGSAVPERAARTGA